MDLAAAPDHRTLAALTRGGELVLLDESGAIRSRRRVGPRQPVRHRSHSSRAGACSRSPRSGASRCSTRAREPRAERRRPSRARRESRSAQTAGPEPLDERRTRRALGRRAAPARLPTAAGGVRRVRRRLLAGRDAHRRRRRRRLSALPGCSDRRPGRGSHARARRAGRPDRVQPGRAHRLLQRHRQRGVVEGRRLHQQIGSPLPVGRVPSSRPSPTTGHRCWRHRTAAGRSSGPSIPPTGMRAHAPSPAAR